jgi:hypothetical protein
MPFVLTQACGIVIAMITASATNEGVTFSIKIVCTGERRGEARKTSPLFEIALVLVRFEPFSIAS